MDLGPPDTPALWRVALPWCALGLVVRVALLVLAGEPELHQDEANYVYLALSWERFGVLGDGERYLWPPLWSAVLRASLQLFGRDGILAAKLLLVASSPIIGFSLVGLGLRVAGERVARTCGALWALYLPLAAYTHLLWAESLFLVLLAPALLTLVEAEQRALRCALPWTFCSGLLFGGALLVKETTLFLLPLLGLGLLWVHRREQQGGGLKRAALFLLAAASVLAPWTARNLEHYGRFAPSGASLGANAFNGLNAHQLNFDVLPLLRQRTGNVTTESISRPLFRAPERLTPWPTAAEVPNTVERSSVEFARGLRWIEQHPSIFVRTRIKRLADFVLPTSYLVRHQGLRRYPGPLGTPFLRRASSYLAVAEVIALLLLAVPGLVRLARRRPPGTWVLFTHAAYIGATCLLVSSSRFRLPVLPVLMLCAALTLRTPELWRERGAQRVLTLLGWATLAFLWWVDLPELQLVLESAW